MLEHLDIFTNWSTKPFSALKSVKHHRFLSQKLDEAIEAHHLAGLPIFNFQTPVSNSSSYRCRAFHLNADADLMLDTDYVLVELWNESGGNNALRMVVNFGEAARSELGYIWNGCGYYEKVDAVVKK